MGPPVDSLLSGLSVPYFVTASAYEMTGSERESALSSSDNSGSGGGGRSLREECVEFLNVER